MRELFGNIHGRLVSLRKVMGKNKTRAGAYFLCWLLILMLMLSLTGSLFYATSPEPINDDAMAEESEVQRTGSSSGSTAGSNLMPMTRSNGDGAGNISLAFFYESTCDCTKVAKKVMEYIKIKYPNVQQFWYNITGEINIENAKKLINFQTLTAYNVLGNDRGYTPFVFIGDYYLFYYGITNGSVSEIIDRYEDTYVPLYPEWKLTWTMHIAFFFDPEVEDSKSILDDVQLLNSTWNQNVTHLIIHNYSLSNPTNGLFFEAYFEKYNLSKLTQYNNVDELYAAVFIDEDFILNSDLTYESINNTVTKHSGHSTALPDIAPNLTGGDIHILIFYDPLCGECNQARDILGDMKAKYPNLNVHEKRLDDSETEILKQTYLKYYNVDPEIWGTLAVFIGDKYFVDVGALKAGIEDQIKRYKDGVALVVLEPDKEIVKDTFNSFTIPLVLAAGLVDSINPCAIAILIFFIGYLTATGRTKKEVLIIGISYTMGVFITYLVLGLGIYYILLTSSSEIEMFSKFLYPFMAAICIIFGVYSLYDYYKARKGKKEDMKLKLPKPLKSLIGRVIKHQVRLKYFALFAIVTGVSVSILEFMCTGQVYLPTIVAVAGSVPELQAQAVLYLILYNLMFISPLVIVFLGVYNGMDAEQLQGFLEKNRAGIKLITAIMFFVLGGFLIWYALEFVYL